MTIWDGTGSLDPYTGLRIRILIFPSVAFKKPTKYKFFSLYFFAYFFAYYLPTEGNFTVHQHKSWRSHKTVEFKVFLAFFADDGRTRTNNYETRSESGRPKNLRILRIRNTEKEA